MQVCWSSKRAPIFQQAEFVFGWARPVPVNPRNFKNPHRDHMPVSFAGPAMNLLIAMLSLVLLRTIMLVVHLLWPETMSLHLATPFSSISLRVRFQAACGRRAGSVQTGLSYPAHRYPEEAYPKSAPQTQAVWRTNVKVNRSRNRSSTA